MKTKICSKCRHSKPLTAFYYTRTRGCYTAWCKDCTRIKTASRQAHLLTSTAQEDVLEATFYLLTIGCMCNGRTRKIPYKLSTGYLRELYPKQQGRCYYTGLPMTLKSPKRTLREPWLISIDRLNPELGYIPGNVVFCCWCINALKGVLKEKSFYDLIRTIYKNLLYTGKLKNDLQLDDELITN